MVSTTKTYSLEKFLESKSKKHSHKDYMEREISERLLNGLVFNVVMRARKILRNFSSLEIAETVDVIEYAIDYLYSNRSRINSPNLITKSNFSEAESLIYVLEHHKLEVREISIRSGYERTSEDGAPDSNDLKNLQYGIRSSLYDAPQLFLSCLSLRDAFASINAIRDADTFSIDFEDTGFVEDEVNDALESAFYAAEKIARALEALILAESLYEQEHLKSKSEFEKETAVKAATKTVLSESTKKAANARQAKNRELRQYAIDLMNQGNYKNPRQATKKIAPLVLKRSKDIQSPLSEDRIDKTVYDWLLSVK